MKFKILIILITVITLNSMQSSRELNDLTIVSAVGIEKKEDNYLITALITTPEKSESGASSSSGEKKVMYQSEAKTIHEALRKMTVESPNKLYLAHLKLLLISEDVAKEDLKDAFDFFVRDTETSNDFIFLLAKDTAPEEILKVTVPNEENLTDNIIDSIESSAKYLGNCDENTLNETLDTILTGTQEVVIPSVKIVKKTEDGSESKESSLNNNASALTGNYSKINEENKEESSEKESSSSSSNEEIKAKIQVANMAYFKDEKLAGYLSDEESVICNLIRNKLNNIVLEVDEEYQFVAEVVKIDIKLKPKYENGEYIVDLNLKSSCNITEIKENCPAISKENIAKYQECIVTDLKEKITSYIYKCQNEYQSDILGYEKLYKKKLNKEYKKVEDIFESEIFKNIKTNVNIEAKIPNYGGIRKEW